MFLCFPLSGTQSPSPANASTIDVDDYSFLEQTSLPCWSRPLRQPPRLPYPSESLPRRLMRTDQRPTAPQQSSLRPSSRHQQQQQQQQSFLNPSQVSHQWRRPQLQQQQQQKAAWSQNVANSSASSPAFNFPSSHGGMIDISLPQSAYHHLNFNSGGGIPP